MTKCDAAQKTLYSLGYKLIKSLYVGTAPGKQCRHTYKGVDINDIETFAYSDHEGNWYVGLTRAEADKRFNAAVIKPKITPDIEDIDATLQELEKNLKIIAVRLLSAVSDFVDKRIERLS